MSILGSVIGGIGSILGGALGGEETQRTKQKTKGKTWSTSSTNNRLQLGKLVRTAERNGFNPLTLLNSGVAGAFVQSQTDGFSRSKSKSKGKGSTSSSSPLGAGIASAAQSFGGAVGSMYDNNSGPETAANVFQSAAPIPLTPTDQAAERSLIQSQLDDRRYGVLDNEPQWPARDVEVMTRPMLDLSSTGVEPWNPNASKDEQKDKYFEDAKATRTNMWPKSWGWVPHPDYADGDSAETRGGDITGMVAGPMAPVMDIKYNLYDRGKAASVYNQFSDWAKSQAPAVDTSKPFFQTWDDAISPYVPSIEMAPPQWGVKQETAPLGYQGGW